jgi:uncharacterized membrane protein
MERNHDNKRIWELDAVRGTAILLMAFDHLTYDLGYLLPMMWPAVQNNPNIHSIIDWAVDFRNSDFASWFRIFFIAGVFLFISGISGNLSRNNERRGIRLFAMAMALTFGTVIAYLMGMTSGIIIYFGILHCLSVAMMLTPLLKKTPIWMLVVLTAAISGIGFYLEYNLVIGNWFLMPFGLPPKYFTTADYYPLLPYLGFYIVGLIFGHYVYNKKESLVIIPDRLKPKWLCYLGRHALFIYFFHQALLMVLVFLLGWIFS